MYVVYAVVVGEAMLTKIISALYPFPSFLSPFAGSVDWKPTTKAKNSRLSPEPPVVPEEKIKEIMERENVWVSDPIEGFIRGRIVDIGEEGATVEPVERGKKPVFARYHKPRLDFGEWEDV